jgi:DNA replication ATP-dependent helicase Dna2
MPGSGKTTTVAFIVRVLIAKGLKVLVTSYTHNAVDSLMSKVLDAGLPIEIMLRIGSESSVDSSLLSILHLDSHMNSTVSNLESSLAKMRLWACTALTIARHPLANKMDFDWCIIDEAGQISQPAAIGPLILAKKFLLVGDDYQLPPLIASHDAKTEV